MNFKALARDRRVLGGVAAVAVIGLAAGAWSMGVFKSTGGGQAAALDLGLMPVAYGEKCGFVDEKGAIVVNPQFDGAGFFTRDGVAPVSTGGKWGLIDRKGNYVVNPQFDTMIMSGDGSEMLVRVGDQWGTVDRKGSYVINPQFSEMGLFDAQGRAIVRSGGKYGFVDRKGQYIIPPQFDVVSIDIADDLSEVTYFHNGLAAASMDGKWGFIDPTGKWVINPQYVATGSFDDSGLAPVMVVEIEETENTEAAQQWDDYHTQQAAQAAAWGYSYERPERPDFTQRTEKNLWGYIDKTGKIVITPQYAHAMNFGAGGLAPVLMGEDWGFIDKTGTLKINPQFDSVNAFTDGPGGALATVAVSGDSGYRWGVIDTTGAYKVNPQFASISSFDRNGRAVVSAGDKWGLIDASGTYVINPMYDELGLIPGSRDYFFVRRGTSSSTVEMGRVSQAGKELSEVSGGRCPGPY